MPGHGSTAASLLSTGLTSSAPVWCTTCPLLAGHYSLVRGAAGDWQVATIVQEARPLTSGTAPVRLGLTISL